MVLDPLVRGEHRQLVDRGRIRGRIGVRRRLEDADDAAAGRTEDTLELRDDRRVRVREPVGQDLRADDDRAVGGGRLAQLAVQAGERDRVGVERAGREQRQGAREEHPRGEDDRPVRAAATEHGRDEADRRGQGDPPGRDDPSPATPGLLRRRHSTITRRAPERFRSSVGTLPSRPIEEPVMTVAAVILAASPASALADADGTPGVRRLTDVAWAGRRDADRRVLVRSRRRGHRRPRERRGHARRPGRPGGRPGRPDRERRPGRGLARRGDGRGARVAGADDVGRCRDGHDAHPRATARTATASPARPATASPAGRSSCPSATSTRSRRWAPTGCRPTCSPTSRRPASRSATSRPATPASPTTSRPRAPTCRRTPGRPSPPTATPTSGARPPLTSRTTRRSPARPGSRMPGA